MSFNTSDKEYLAQIEKRYVSRKKRGLLLIAVSIILICVSAYFFYDNSKKVIDMANDTAEISDLVTDQAIRDDAIKVSNKFAYIYGASTAASIVGLLIGGIMLLSNGLYLLLGSRKERLLVELYNRLKEEHGDNAT